MADKVLAFYKKNTLPSTLQKDSIYFDKVEGKDQVKMILTDGVGNPLKVGDDSLVVSIIDTKVGNPDTDFLAHYNLSKIT